LGYIASEVARGARPEGLLEVHAILATFHAERRPKGAGAGAAVFTHATSCRSSTEGIARIASLVQLINSIVGLLWYGLAQRIAVPDVARPSRGAGPNAIGILL